MEHLSYHVKNIKHPLIKDAYLKRNPYDAKSKDTLILETTMQQASDDLIDILSDLDALRFQAEKEVGHFDAIDIRSRC